MAFFIRFQFNTARYKCKILQFAESGNFRVNTNFNNSPQWLLVYEFNLSVSAPRNIVKIYQIKLFEKMKLILQIHVSEIY